MRRKDILEEARAMHNDICIVAGCDLVRLIGYHEDELDSYWHVLYMNGRCPGEGNAVMSSAVGGCLSLRGLVPETHYKVMDQVFSLNGAPKSEEFVISIASDEDNQRLYHRDTW